MPMKKDQCSEVQRLYLCKGKVCISKSDSDHDVESPANISKKRSSIESLKVSGAEKPSDVDDDDDVPLFTEKDFARLEKEHSARKGDDGEDVPLFAEKELS